MNKKRHSEEISNGGKRSSSLLSIPNQRKPKRVRKKDLRRATDEQLQNHSTLIIEDMTHHRKNKSLMPINALPEIKENRFDGSSSFPSD